MGFSNEILFNKFVVKLFKYTMNIAQFLCDIRSKFGTFLYDWPFTKWEYWCSGVHKVNLLMLRHIQHWSTTSDFINWLALFTTSVFSSTRQWHCESDCRVSRSYNLRQKAQSARRFRWEMFLVPPGVGNLYVSSHAQYRTSFLLCSSLVFLSLNERFCILWLYRRYRNAVLLLLVVVVEVEVVVFVVVVIETKM